MNNVIFTKAYIYRNLKDYKFVPKLEEEKKQEIEDKLLSCLKDKMSLINLSTADKKVVDYLKSNSLLNSNYKSVLVSQKDNVSVSLFNGEHVCICATSVGYDKSIFKKVKAVADVLSSRLSLSYSDEYGYLMSDLSKIGTGVKLESRIVLQALKTMGKIEQLKRNIKNLGYSLTNTEDKDEFILSTICNLGFTESEIFKEFDKMVAKLQDLEIESVKMLDVENHDEILDKVQRSIAILKSANLMNYAELNDHIKNLRIGNNLGLCDIKDENITKLQNLLTNKKTDFISKTELLNLAKDVKSVLKGEKDV